MSHIVLRPDRRILVLAPLGLLLGTGDPCLARPATLVRPPPDVIVAAADYSFYEIMQGLDSFLRVRDQYNATGTYRDGVFSPGGRTKRTGHQLRISDPRGDPINIALDQGQATYCIHNNERDRVVGFIREMSERTGWPYQEDKWCWEGLRLTTYKKGDFSAERLNNGTYSKMVSLRPFSMAMTSGNNIEYTHVLPTTTE